jgi:hypothetical protein
MSEDEISEEGKQARFARWEELGVDRIKADLLAGGHRLVGGPPSVRELAWKWVREKEAKPEEVLQLSPNFHGVGIDLKAAFRKGRSFIKRKLSRD